MHECVRLCVAVKNEKDIHAVLFIGERSRRCPFFFFLRRATSSASASAAAAAAAAAALAAAAAVLSASASCSGIARTISSSSSGGLAVVDALVAAAPFDAFAAGDISFDPAPFRFYII